MLDTFHDWKRHFGLGEDVDEADVKDRDDVEGESSRSTLSART